MENSFEFQGRHYIEKHGQISERHVFHDGYCVERIVQDPSNWLCLAAQINMMKRDEARERYR